MWQLVIAVRDGLYTLHDKCGDGTPISLAIVKHNAKLHRKARKGFYALGVWTNPALA
jgi:hypothetical protein